MARTLRSRVAAVAVAALGAGVLVATPASATVPTLFKVQTAEAIGADTDTAVTIAGPSNFVEIASKVDASANTFVRLEVSGAGATFDTTVTNMGTGGTPAAATWSSNIARTTLTSSSNDIYGTPGRYQSVKVYTTTPGSVTVKVYEVAGSAGVFTDTLKDTLSLTVNAEATAGTVSASKSTSILDKTATAAYDAALTEDEKVVASGLTAGALVAIAKVTLKDVNGVNMPNSTSVTATIAGPGSVALNTTDTALTYGASGGSVSGTISSGVIYAGIYADGAAGVSTITIKVGTTVIATETVTFYGAVATLTATALRYSVADTANVTCTSNAVTSKDGVVAVLTAKDANGVAVPLAYGDFTAVSGTVLTDQKLTSVTFCNGDGTNVATGAVAVIPRGIAGKTGTKSLTVKHTSTAVTATFSFVVAVSKASTVVISTDKANYAPGEAVKYTVTAKDADGNIIPDGLVTSAITSATNVFQNGELPSNLTFKNGVATFSLFAPSTPGDFTFTATLGSALVATDYVGTTASATVKVVGDTAAIDAVKADLAKTQAAITALSTTVSSIQTAVATLVASMAATLTVIQSQINKILKKINLK